ncbi:hypothetical protein RJ639_004843 [Escallonia herrerae]|uniref:Leucine-rich repeat-containing N-terminal plant-type domain-containing protein n=1 Tax=Escallonia herrerae TaxID=1293975 RepID=A0AA89AUQ5_9ASTE|nr:hypothetical protein RJ639_004843 [Escallonia herrerae]
MGMEELKELDARRKLAEYLDSILCWTKTHSVQVKPLQRLKTRDPLEIIHGHCSPQTISRAYKIKKTQGRKISKMMGNESSELCIGEIKVSQRFQRSKELRNSAALKVVPAQVHVSQIRAGCRSAWVFNSEIKLDNMSGSCITEHSTPFAAIFAFPRRKTIGRIATIMGASAIANVTVLVLFCSIAEGKLKLEQGLHGKERRALLSFRKELTDPSNRLCSWSAQGDCCQWAGVRCDNITHHAVELHLGNPYDSDDIDSYEMFKLGGKISPLLLKLDWISGLHSLEYLDMSGVDLSKEVQ